MAEISSNKDNKDPQVGLDELGDGLEKVLDSATTTGTPIPANSGVASKQEINGVLVDILAAKKLPITQDNFNKVLTSACHLAQEGATSPKFAENRKIDIYGVTVKVSDLRQSCKKMGITVRKLARGLQNEIVAVAKRRNIEGNLSKSYKIENPNYDLQDLIWVSDFQTFNENPAMPESVRMWLLENYRNRFKPSSKPNYRIQENQED